MTACWTRLMLFMMRWLPAFVITALVYPVTAVTLSAGGAAARGGAWESERSACRAGVPAPSPASSVFLQFALTYLDRLWHLHFQREVSWEIIGKEDFEALQQTTGGALVFTVHSGNYDIGAGLFARKFGRPIHTVRIPEATASLQKLREENCARRSAAIRICTSITTSRAATSAWNSAASCSQARSSASRATVSWAMWRPRTPASTA
jgi:predicted LPLAT superfamily acyltransferase